MDKKFKIIFTMVDGSEHIYPNGGHYKSKNEARSTAMRTMDDSRFIIYDKLILNVRHIVKAEILEIVEKDV